MNGKKWVESNSEKLIEDFYDSSVYQDLFAELQNTFEEFVNEKLQEVDKRFSEVEVLIMDDISISDIEEVE